MFTTGSKLLIGGSALAVVLAIAYGLTQDGTMGTIGLVSAAIALGLLAGIDLAVRDANVSADDERAVATCPAARPVPGRSVWPLAFAVGSVALTVGLVTYQAVFVVGVLLILATGLEWTLHAWAERASGDPAYNSQVRSRFAGPLEFPLAGAVVVGVIVYSFSRIMLWLSKTNTVVAFAVLAGLLLMMAFLFAFRPSVKQGAVATVAVLACTALIAGGVGAALDGQRDIEQHETVDGLVDEGVPICESPEEFEVDENTSQTVSITANVTADDTLTSGGELEFSVPGDSEAGVPYLTLARSNPSNILFTNEADEARRLSIDLGTAVVESESGVEEEIPNQACTALVEDGGQQLLTIIIGMPSAAVEGGYRFFVPGVDTAELEVVVP
jgi:hypothetical protein